MTLLHFGHLPLLPAYSSGTVILLPQLGQENRICICITHEQGRVASHKWVEIGVWCDRPKAQSGPAPERPRPLLYGPQVRRSQMKR